MGRWHDVPATAFILLLALSLGQPGVLWTYSGEVGFATSPAVADLEGDGTLEVVVGSYDTNVYCILGDGGFEWKYKTGGAVTSSPVTADLDGDGTLEVIVGSADGAVYVLDHTGAHRWHFDTGGSISAAAAVGDIDGDGVPDIVVGSEDNNAYAFAARGILLWKHELGGDVLAAPLIVDVDGDGGNEVVLGADDGTLTVLDGLTQEVEWTFTGEGRIRTAPVAADLDGDGSLEVLVGSDAGVVTAIASDGTTQWTFRTQGAVTATPMLTDLDGDRSLDVLVGSAEGGLYIIDAKGGLKWNTGSHAVTGRPAVGDLDGDGRPDIAYGTGENNTRVIDVAGAEIWSFHMTYPTRGSPVIADLLGDETMDLVFTSMDATVYAFGFPRRPSVVSQYQDRTAIARSLPRPTEEVVMPEVDLSEVMTRLDALESSANETQQLVGAIPDQVNCTAVISSEDSAIAANTIMGSFRHLSTIVFAGAAVLAIMIIIVLRQHARAPVLARPTIFVDGTHGNFVAENVTEFSKMYEVFKRFGKVVFLKTFFIQPKEGDILVIGVPRKPFSREEIALIHGYVKQKGLRLFIVAEWGGDQKNNEYLNQVVGELGAYFNPDLICDYDKGGNVSYTPILEGLANHPITRGLIGVRINAACSITIENKKVQPLVWGSKASFADQNFNLTPDEFEKRGYIVFMAGLELGKGKVILCGDSDLFNDSNLQGYHLSLLNNVIQWFGEPVKEIGVESHKIGASDVVQFLKPKR